MSKLELKYQVNVKIENKHGDIVIERDRMVYTLDDAMDTHDSFVDEVYAHLMYVHIEDAASLCLLYKREMILCYCEKESSIFTCEVDPTKMSWEDDLRRICG